MEQPIAWLMTIVAAAGMTAYADGLEKRSATPVAVEAPPAQAKVSSPRNDESAARFEQAG